MKKNYIRISIIFFASFALINSCGMIVGNTAEIVIQNLLTEDAFGTNGQVQSNQDTTTIGFCNADTNPDSTTSNIKYIVSLAQSVKLFEVYFKGQDFKSNFIDIAAVDTLNEHTVKNSASYQVVTIQWMGYDNAILKVKGKRQIIFRLVKLARDSGSQTLGSIIFDKKFMHFDKDNSSRTYYSEQNFGTLTVSPNAAYLLSFVYDNNYECITQKKLGENENTANNNPDLPFATVLGELTKVRLNIVKLH